MLDSKSRGRSIDVGVMATLVFALGGCSSNSGGAGSGAGDDAGGGDSGSTTSFATACAAQASAICMLRSSCSMTFNIDRDFPDLATCESRTTQTCVNNAASTGTGLTVASVTACAAAYPSEACTDYFDGNPVAACVPQAGTRATGAACGASSQCTSTYCAVTQSTVCGTCQPLPQAGATCQVDADCGRDLACAVATGATSGTCAAYGVSGAACLTGKSPCGAGLACVGDDVTTMTSGTCMTQGATVGAACDGSRKTAANCAGAVGLVCIPAAAGSAVGTCQNISFVTAGTTCGDIGSAPITGFSECEAGGLCAKATATAATGTCVAPAADGAPCDNDTTVGPPCLAPAKCVPTASGGTAGVCTVPNASTCM